MNIQLIDHQLCVRSGQPISHMVDDGHPESEIWRADQIGDLFGAFIEVGMQIEERAERFPRGTLYTYFVRAE